MDRKKEIMNRRKFFSLLSVSTVSALLSANINNDILSFLKAIYEKSQNKQRLPFTINELILKESEDLIERDPYYLKKWSESFEYVQDMKYIGKAINTINQSKIKIPKGNIIVLGAYNCRVVDMLMKKYMYRDCIGVDTVKHTNHPRLVVHDIKLLKSGDFGPIGFGWNSVLSNWEQNPRSKLAGFNFLKESLVFGGLLIDRPLERLPKDLNTKGLKLMKISKKGTCWQKVSG